MLWPDMLRDFARRIEEAPNESDVKIDYYSYNTSPNGRNHGETVEIKLELPLPDTE